MIFTRNRMGIVLSASFILLGSCSNNDNNTTPTPTISKEWNINLSTKNENPPPPGRTETGTVNLQLMSDNSLKYTINVSGLASGDALAAAHLHAGDAITSGPIILGLDPVFTSGSATGTITAVRTSLVDSLKDSTKEIYVNVHSTQVPGGLARGQVNTNIELATDLTLSSANEVPAGTSAATGVGILRLTSAKNAYLKLTVTGLETGDTLTAAHIHKAASGVNGPIIVPFYASPNDFGSVKIVQVVDSVFAMLKNDPIYMNAHSKTKPGGIIRAQIR